MPNRILKDSICTSETVDVLTPDAEVFFYRLMVQCDDFGRMDARPQVLRARCYPLKLDKVTDKAVGGWLAALVKAGLVWTYEVDGKRFLQVTTWEKHQQVRAKRSKWPDPQQPDSSGYQVISGDSNCPRESINENRESINENRESRIEDESAAAPLPPILRPVQIFLDNGGKLPSGKLADGTTRKAKAVAYICERVADTPDSLSLWGKVVSGYCGQWSGASYMTMVTDYYEQGRIPGQAQPRRKGTANNGHLHGVDEVEILRQWREEAANGNPG